MTGFAGMSGARELACAHRSFLSEELPSSIVRRAMRERPCYDLPDGADFLARVKLKDGGVLRSLWILSQKLQCGFEIDIRKIPVLQEMVEVCEILHEDLYTIPSYGGWIAASTKSRELLALCSREQIPAAVIGKTTAGMARAISMGDSVRYLEGP